MLIKTVICAKIVIFIVFYNNLVMGRSRPGSTTRRCEFYNETQCLETGTGCNTTMQECESTDGDKRNHCYALWQNSTNSSTGYSLKMKGCWLNHVACYDQPECIEKREEPKKKLMFCCCEGDMCNRDTYHIPMPTVPATVGEEVPIEATYDSHQVVTTLLYTLLPFSVLAVLVVLLYYVYRQHKMTYFNEVPTMDPSSTSPPSPLLGLRPVQLIEIKARGRFGAVWKAKMITESVAVKIFPIQDKQSWLAEQEVFHLSQFKHENILAYIGAEKRDDNVQPEYWIISAFHERGSLYDYLKANVLTWNELTRIALTMANGLTHLHEEIAANKVDGMKPAVAHRDFKSKNVLIKSDLSACIADFGLALIFYPGVSPGDTHGQVGTRRYMAPEVLEGAINFQRDSFLRIDMYACGLVLWELMSRCTLGAPVEEYRLPFEEEVGQHPSLEDMQETVATKKLRPKLKEHWRKTDNMSQLCDTIDECWDHDAEARLSASCVQERVTHLIRRMMIQHQHNQQNNNSSSPPTTLGGVGVEAPLVPAVTVIQMTTGNNKLLSSSSSLTSLIAPKESSI